MTSCSLGDKYQRFGGTYYLSLKTSYTEGVGSIVVAAIIANTANRSRLYSCILDEFLNFIALNNVHKVF